MCRTVWCMCVLFQCYSALLQAYLKLFGVKTWVQWLAHAINHGLAMLVLVIFLTFMLCVKVAMNKVSMIRFLNTQNISL